MALYKLVFSFSILLGQLSLAFLLFSFCEQQLIIVFKPCRYGKQGWVFAGKNLFLPDMRFKPEKKNKILLQCYLQQGFF